MEQTFTQEQIARVHDFYPPDTKLIYIGTSNEGLEFPGMKMNKGRMGIDPDWKLILSPLSAMSESEMVGLLNCHWPADMDIEDKPSDDEYDVDMFYNDDGCDVDADVAVGAGFTCRCHIGQIAITLDGNINFYNEAGDLDRFPGQPQAFAYLLSKGFDLFGLIPAGLAIDKTTL